MKAALRWHPKHAALRWHQRWHRKDAGQRGTVRRGRLSIHSKEASYRYTRKRHLISTCNTLQHNTTHYNTRYRYTRKRHLISTCNTLQHNTTHYNTRYRYTRKRHVISTSSLRLCNSSLRLCISLPVPVCPYRLNPSVTQASRTISSLTYPPCVLSVAS